MSSNKKIMIEVQDLHKSFSLPLEKSGSIKDLFVSPFKKRVKETQKVLSDVNLKIPKGEFFGVVGKNGSGKSTLLKLLAEIYTPDSGTVEINGKLTPFIELGVGFNPELTGRENVFLNGALLGFNRREIQEMYSEIVDFAGLERFMGQKLKNYSSGMQVRLAFSIAIRTESDILLIDEVLAVGDAAFQRKCYETFNRLKQEGRTIVFITHDMSAVERFCDRVAVLNEGEIVGIYKPSKAASVYQRLNAEYDKKSSQKTKPENRWGTGEVKVLKTDFFVDGSSQNNPTYTTGQPFEMKITINNPEKRQIVAGISIEDAFGVNISGPNSLGVEFKGNILKFKIEKLPLVTGEYKVTCVLFDQSLSKEYDHLEKFYTFRVVSENGQTLHGKVDMFGKWS